jgi:alpha-1,2-mannosyltransferase
MPESSSPSFGSLVLTVAAAVAGIVGLTASAGLVDAMPLAWIVAVAAAGLAVRRLSQPDARAVIDAAPRGYRLAFGAGAALLLVQLVALTVFIIDPTVAAWRAAPWTPMSSQHACSTAYWTACEAAARGASLYDDNLSSIPQRSPGAPRVPRPMGPLSIDPYEYPPSFLPVPALLQRITGDYWGFRRLWFALTLGMVAVVAVLVARRLDHRLGTHALWLTPYLLTAPTMITTLGIGNVQLATIAAAVAAMLLFERGRFAAGGLALGWGAAGKLFPGLLVVYLLLRREWRAAAWTTAWAVTFALVSLAMYGTTPWIEFLHEMPRLLSGEAFSAFRSPNAIANNQSVPGLVFKLKLAGVPHMDYAAMRLLGWAYTAGILAVTAWLALRARPQGREPLVWLAILFLATMRSPFLPTYAAFPTLWLGTLVLATSGGRPAVTRATVAIVALVSLSWGIGFMPPLVNASWTALQTIAAFALVTIACAALRDPAGSPACLSTVPERVNA